MTRKRRERAEYSGAKRLEKDLERQLLLNGKLNGDVVDGLPLEELKSLETQLRKSMDIVDEKLAKEYPKLAKLTDFQSIWMSDEKASKEELRFWAMSRNETEKTRQLWRGFKPSEMETEIERLKLLNERMCGRELEGIGFYRLQFLRMSMYTGFNKVRIERVRDILRRTDD